jgi:ABC-type multidrug transport system ATPase subunit
MKIVLENIGRRFNREWIFRGVNYNFESGQSYAILGINGSGKSTFLQILSGSLTPSEGNISYLLDHKNLDIESVFPQLSMAAPYLDLIDEFTLEEHIDFHFRFKRFAYGFDTSGIIELLGLERSASKLIKHFSSGMKQRTKLALAFCSDTPVLLLDEPASNLDKDGVAWYLELVKRYTQGRLVIICSNQEQEYAFCKNLIQVADYK